MGTIHVCFVLGETQLINIIDCQLMEHNSAHVRSDITQGACQCKGLIIAAGRCSEGAGHSG